MDEHLSDFALDLARLGGTKPEHLDACEECQARLGSIAQRAERAVASPAFARVARAAQQVEVHPPWWRRWWPVLVPVAIAATVVLVMRAPAPEPEIRFKGPVSVEVVARAKRLPGTAMHPGEKAVVRVEANGHPEAVVFVVSEQGAVEQLWPTAGDFTGVIPPGGALAEVEVTPGTMRLVAGFFDSHRSVAALREALERRPANGKLQGPLADEEALAEQRVVVSP